MKSRWQAATRRANAALHGHAGQTRYGRRADMTRKMVFSNRRWAWRAELHAERLHFFSLAQRLAVEARRVTNYDASTAKWPHRSTPAHANLLLFTELLHLPVGRGDRRVEDAAILIGVTRAVLVYEVGACVGLLDPTLLVPGACAGRLQPMSYKWRTTTDVLSHASPASILQRLRAL